MSPIFYRYYMCQLKEDLGGRLIQNNWKRWTSKVAKYIIMVAIAPLLYQY